MRGSRTWLTSGNDQRAKKLAEKVPRWTEKGIKRGKRKDNWHSAVGVGQLDKMGAELATTPGINCTAVVYGVAFDAR